MLKRFLSIFLLFFLITLLIVSLTDGENSAPSVDENTPVEIDDEDFDGVIWAMPDEEAMATSERVEVSKIAPDFTLETLDGGTLTLSDLKGKKVFLNFWATWCHYCLEEMPAMQQMYDKYSDELVIIGLNTTGAETSVDEVKPFVEQMGITFPIVLDKDLEVTYNKYQAFALPTTFFINTEGVVQFKKHVGPMTFEQMEEKFNELD